MSGMGGVRFFFFLTSTPGDSYLQLENTDIVYLTTDNFFSTIHIYRFIIENLDISEKPLTYWHLSYIQCFTVINNFFDSPKYNSIIKMTLK